jgi:hypothetical protein
MRNRFYSRWKFAGSLLAFAGVFAFSPATRAELLLGFDVNGLAGSQLATTNSVSAANIDTASPFARITRGSGLIAGAGAGSMLSSSWTLPTTATIANSITSNDFHTLKISPASGYTLDLTNFSVRITRSGTGASNFVLRASTDNFGSDLATWRVAGTGISNFVATLSIAASTGVEFRVYGFGSGNAGGTARVPTDGADFGTTGVDLAIFGTAVAAGPEIAVSGNGVTITDGDATPSASDHTDFGDVLVDGGTLTRTYTITNSGSANLTLGTVTTSGTHAADFIVTAQPASPVTPGGSTTFQVQFNPSAVGARTAEVSFTNNDSDENPFNFAIQGTGAAPEIAVSGNGNDIADGDITPSATDGTDYGNVLIGNNLDQTFVITNTGNAALSLGNVTTSGTHAVEFSIITQPTSPLAVSNSTTFVVRFSPSGSGVRSASLSFTNSDSSENPFNFDIQGSGVSAAPNMILLGTNLATIANGDTTPATADGTDFGSANVVGATVTRTFTITNDGNASLTVSSWTTSGTHAVDFQITTAPGGTVAAGATTTFVITFNPSDRGLREATFSLANNDGPNNPYTFAVQGAGLAPEIAVSGNGNNIADGSATPALSNHTDFSGADIAGGTVTRTYTVTNTGNTSLTLGSVTTGGTHAADFIVVAQPAAFLAVSNSTTFQVQFDPSATGTRSATLSFSNGDPDEDPFNFSIQGTGTVNPEIAVLGTNGALIADGDNVPAFADGTDFGATAVTGGLIDRTLSITNSGSGALTITGVTTTGTHAADFAVVSWPAIVSPGARSNLVLRFDPTASGVRTAAVMIASDDADEASYDFAVRGTGQVPPTVTTTIASSTNLTSASAGGNVTADGFADVTNRGVVWALSPATPTVPGAQTTNGPGTGSYTSTLTNLTPGATYNYRAFAQNSLGTSYGAQQSLTTPCFGGVVTGLVVTATNTADFTAVWSNVAFATGYQLDVSTSATFGATSSDEDFTDGNFSATPTWAGDTTRFEILTAGTLPSGSASTDGSYLGSTNNVGNAILTTPSSETNEWRFSLGSPTFDASSANHFGVILMSDAAIQGDVTTNSFNGYYLRMGVDGATDYLELWRSSGGTKAKIGDFSAAGNFGSGALDDGMNLRITRSDSGVFELFYATGFTYASTPSTSAGTLTNTVHNSSAYFGVYARFANPSTTRRMYVDNIALGAASPSYVPGYSNRAVASTSATVTGLTDGVTYYWRVRATNEHCVTDASVTQSVTTVVGDDVTGPALSGFNIDATTLTDAQISSGFTVTGLVFDAGGVSNAVHTPYLFLKNNSNNTILASNKFDVAPANGTTVLGPLSETFTGAAYANVTLGSYTGTVGAVDVSGNAAVSNFVFSVVDDDTTTPTIASADIDYGGVGSRYFAITTNSTPASITNRAGTFANVRYVLTDEELDQANARDLRFAFGVRDAGSGIARGAAGSTNTVMSFSLENAVSGNITNYRLDLSSANYTNARTTNVWSFPAGFFTESLINGLMAVASNRVTITVPDDDNDRTNDQALLVSETVGWVSAVDDDAVAPVFSSVRIGAVGGGSGFTTNFAESMGTAGSSGDTIATHESNNRFDNAALTMSGSGDMRTTLASTGYPGASGNFNVMFNNTAEDFLISGIDSTAASDWKLIFGIRKNSNDEDGSLLTVDVSTNGTAWVTLGFDPLPTGSGTAGWYLTTNTTGVIPAGTNLRVRFTAGAIGVSDYFRIDDVRLVRPDGSGNTLTDGQLLAGVALTGLVQDAYSGIYGTNHAGVFAPTASVLNASGVAVFGARFAGGPANGGAVVAAPFSNLVVLASNDLVVGATYTSRVVVWDYDFDRTSDQLAATQEVAFTVIDDDTNAPAVGGFSLAGATTNYDLSFSSIAVTGTITDASGIQYGPSYFLVLGGAGVAQSNTLFAGAGNAATGTITDVGLLCGQDYTIRVVVADADLDRGNDALWATQQVAVIRTIGVGGPADFPIASNLLLNGAAASPAVTVTDANIATGGWSVALSLSHPVGVFTNTTSPSFRITNVFGGVVGSLPWSNGVLSGLTYFFTNNAMPAVAYGSVQTGLHYVVWSASNQGSCVANIVDRGIIAGGTNAFTVVDDDAAPPTLSAFAVSGESTTIDVATALSGFAVTGLIQDADSGVGFTSQPPYILFMGLTGGALASNVLPGAEAAGQSAAVTLSNYFSGLSLTCGNSYTVRVVAADADNDRAADRAVSTNDVLIIVTSGSDGDAPTAENLLLNNIPAASATLTDQSIATGGWRVALSFAHPSGDIVTNGPNAPSFLVRNSAGSNLFGATPIAWSNVVKSGLSYYATNFPMSSADTNLVSTGLYSIVWSAQSDGLCFGLTNASARINPGTNTFLVIDDDAAAPELYGVAVGGGTGTGCGGGGGGCPDPTRTNLVAGDIAIFAMNTLTRAATNNDSFAFVALVDLPTGTQIKFTDNGWKSSTASFRNNEGSITWRATNCVPAGTVVRWIATNTPVFNIGVLHAVAGSFAPNIEGEQILAYQGSDSSPNFIYALNDRLDGIWDVDAVDSHSSAIPPGLADGYTAVAVGEFDNVILNTNNLAISGGRDAILFYISDPENWIGSDATVFDLLAYNFTFPDICSSGGTITDHDLAFGGWSITGLVQDVGSGLSVSNAGGVRYMVWNTNAGVVVSNFFATTFAEGSKLLHGLSNAIPGGDYNTIQLGVHTARLFAADADNDRAFDAAERVTNVAFTVIDDDTDIPQLGFFSINGQTTITNAADLLSVVISGQVRDVTSGVGFTSAPPTYVVLDSIGSSVATGGFANAPAVEGAGLNWTSIWTAPINLGGIADCGIYTVRVTIADADNDRINDRRQTNLAFVISVATGTGEEPVASNLLVNAVSASVTSITDAQLAAGGWSLAMSLHHPVGLRVDSPFTPSYELRDPANAALFGQDWTNIQTAGGSVYVTNDLLPGVAYGSVQTGYHPVVWSARSQGACYGEVFGSPFFGDGTNLVLVVDDDTTGPTAASNFTSTAAYWTNRAVITYTWNTSSVSDASGVASYRFVTNGLAPTSLVNGVIVGLTNQLVWTNLSEGIHTNWLFAVDADNDRTNDAAMGASTSVVVYLDFTAPAQVTGLAAAPGAADDTSEIDLTWTPLPDAGNPALSPWDTYRIYYTQDGVADPTTNDPFVDASTLADLGTNIAASVTMQGLSMGAEYRLAMAGLDRAGNLGPISGVQTVTLGQIIITQAYANAQSHPVLSWLGNPGAFYDVIYADSTGYTPNIDTQWKLAAMVFGTTWTDEGGIDEGTGNVRLAPMQLPNKSMRFYRVAVANAWVPTANRLGGATTQIVVALKTVLTNGYNFIGMGMTPFENTLADFFGTNRLPASNSVAASTSVSVYEPTSTGDAATNAWWLSATEGWKYEFGSASANTQAIPYPYTGFNVQIPDTAPASTNLLLLGRVPWTNPPTFNLETNRYHVVTLNLPRPTRLGETGLKDYVARGTSIFVADEIRVLQRGLGPFGAPKVRVFVNTSGDYRYHTGGSGSASNYVIEVDDAIIVHTKRLTNAVTWSMPLPYVAPKLQITNRLNAAPIVVAQAPLNVTATGATLRGQATPNNLATEAHIKYGPTTNYGFSVALTNLPGTNLAFALSGAISGLSTGTVYYYRVWASNSAGVSRFGTGSFTTLGACTNGAPSSPSVTAGNGASTNQVAVTWSNVSLEDGYEIWRNTVNLSGSASLLGAVGANTTNFNDTGATPGQQYYYWVKAYNCAGDSGFGASDAGYRQLESVSGVTATYNTFTNRILIQWANISGETGFGVWRHTANVSGSSSYIGSAPADALAYTDTTAVADTEYYYWVRGTNNTSGAVGAFQPGGALGRRSSVGMPTLSLPTASNILTTTSVTGATLGATIDSDGGAAITSRGTTWDTSASPTANSLVEGGTALGAFFHTRTSMAAGTLIYFRGWASNSAGKAYSGDGTFWTAPDCPILHAATNFTTNSFAVSWSASAGATNHLLDVSTSPSFASFVAGYSNRASGGGTSAVVTNLSIGTLHYWRVRAQNSGGTSLHSTTNTGYAVVAQPADQAEDLAFGSVGATNMTVSWTPGSGEFRLVVARSGASVTGLPSDGQTYAASGVFGGGAQIGAGNYVLYSGTGSSVAVSGLAPATAYFFRVFEFNGTGGFANYLTNSASGNPAGQSTL